MLDRLAGKENYYFLNGSSGYYQIALHPDDQENTTFKCPFRTYAFRRMSFRLCNAPATFMSYMIAIFADMLEERLDIFKDVFFSIYGDSFVECLHNLERVLKRCKETNLVLNWETHVILW